MRHRILVPIQDDPATLHELDAVPVGDGQFRLVGRAPSGTRLQFKRGEIVECAARKLPNGSHGLVATYSISADPESRKRRIVYAVLGAFVGLVPGPALALFSASTRAAASDGPLLLVAALSGAAIFSYCSWRWGDAAWRVLGRVLRGL